MLYKEIIAACSGIHTKHCKKGIMNKNRIIRIEKVLVIIALQLLTVFSGVSES